MLRSKVLAFSAISVALLGCSFAAAPAQAQVSVEFGRVGVNVGVAPVCPYGYFDYAPYDCSPYGYYGPDWFNGGVFVGSGPWFHGRANFYGHVDNRYDPRQGYRGPVPERGALQFNHFKGNEARDGRGNVGSAGHEASSEHALPGYKGGGKRR